MSLVDTWLDACKAAGFKSNTDCLSDLNRKTGLNVLNNRLYEWRAGKGNPPPKAVDYMLRASILYALRQIRPRSNLAKHEIDQLAEMLKLPKSN